jgi:hypothetical protein
MVTAQRMQRSWEDLSIKDPLFDLHRMSEPNSPINPIKTPSACGALVSVSTSCIALFPTLPSVDLLF